MADAPHPDGPQAPLCATDELVAAWDHFRAGDVVPCPLDRAHLALAVDAAAGVYRFVCTQCGAASPWFESGPTGIRLRGPSADPLQPED
ncbi:MAG TPA: hypothetical protein VN894_00760 [Polyangiaceae bacterium]|nr:hypothetical protein [Polyangiaceae bacterium]